MRYLPDTFGMRAEELTGLLNRAKDQYAGDLEPLDEADHTL